MAKVYIVFCMDTEGPCDDPNNHKLLKNWNQVDPAVDKLFDENLRYYLPDINNGHLKIGWFFLTWTGFKTNPRNREFGYHKVRDHYLSSWSNDLKKFKDEHCWHYHQPSISRVGNEWSTDWGSSEEYIQILSKQILDRRWFPSCYRAGGTIMDNTSSKWVDKWFPFDYSNRAPLDSPYVDWSDGVKSWRPYKPSKNNFKNKGDLNRYMARCLDLKTGIQQIGENDIIQAFDEAESYGSSILSVFDHDYRDIKSRIINFFDRVKLVSDAYPHVDLEYSNPSEAIVNCVAETGAAVALDINLNVMSQKILVKVNQDIYQNIPWVTYEDRKGTIYQLSKEVKKIDDHLWEVNINNCDIKKFGVGVSSSLGQSCTKVLNENDLK